MLGVVLALLLQATDPVQPVEPVAQAQPEVTQTEAQPEAEAAPAEEQARERRCRGRNVTGTRLATAVVCRSRNSQQGYETRETIRNFQRFDPPPSN